MTTANEHQSKIILAARDATSRACAAQVALSSSSADAASLATACVGFSSMADSLHSWLLEGRFSTNKTDTAASGDGVNESNESSELNPTQMEELLQRVATFASYASVHAQTSADMAKRAAQRVAESRLASQEAQNDERKVAEYVAAFAAVAANGGKKRLSDGNNKTTKTATKKSKTSKSTAKPVSSSPAAASATVASKPPPPAAPTKLQKDLAKEIKIIKSASNDKSNDYTVRRAIQRIEALVDKTKENKTESGAEALIKIPEGIDTVLLAFKRSHRPFFKSSDDMSYMVESVENITAIVASSDAGLAELFAPDRLSVLWEDVKKNKAQSTFLSAIVECISKSDECRDAFAKVFTVEDISRFCAEDQFDKAEPSDEPHFDYIDSTKHRKINQLLCLIASSSDGLAKMKERSEAVIKYVSAHSRE